uniref:Secreted protein n=1 Tax=Anopheles coluzzii TaxID=1518534 RepID=A0A8W7P5S8_ANOCL
LPGEKMARFSASVVALSLLVCLAVGARAQMVCWSCYDCGVNSLQATVCGTPTSGGGGGSNGQPTLPTSPQPTLPTAATTVWPQGTWYPPLSSTVTPWGRSIGYMCYRNQRYIASQNRYTYDRGCALQLNSHEATCRSLDGNVVDSVFCEFCTGSLCNY